MYKSVRNRLLLQLNVETIGEAILKLIENGKSNSEIAKLFSVSDSLICYYKKRSKELPFLQTSAERSIYTHNQKHKEYIKRWKSGNESGGRKEGYGVVSNHVRRYIFEKYESKCAKCGWSEVNKFTNTIPLEIEHIDGNPENHLESNLILLCPNCHSLTAGHSSNKENGRRYNRELYRFKNNNAL